MAFLLFFGSSAALADPQSVSIDTNNGTASYSSGVITITCSDKGDGAGIFLGQGDWLTVTADTGYVIRNIELVVGCYEYNSHYITTTAGQLTGNTPDSTNISNTNINASTVTYQAKLGGTFYILQIIKVTVYYESLPDISGCTVSAIEDQAYTGSQITPEPTVKDGDKVLQKNVDYTLEYGDNVNAADGGSVIVKGMGDYMGSKTVSFNITKVGFTIELGQKEFAYDGQAHVPAYTVKGVDSKVLTEGVDYHVDIAGGAVSKQTEPGEVEMNFFADNANYKDAKASYRILPKKEFKVISGAGQSSDVSSGMDAVFKSDAEYADFVKLIIDGRDVDPENYTTASGSTVVTVKNAYLKTLTNGEHKLSIVSKTGSADTSFSVKRASTVPATGDASNTAVLWIALAAAGAVLVTAACKKKIRG